MVTYAQAQERAEEWINGDVPAYQHREVRVREFELGFVVWGEDRAEGPRSDAGAQRLVIARDSGEATLWPALPVGEVIRRYEEEYGRPDGPQEAAPAPAVRLDLNQTSFLLTPPEWLQEAADRMGIGERRQPAADSGASQGAGVAGSGASEVAGVTGSGASEGAGVSVGGDPARTLAGPPPTPAAPAAPAVPAPAVPAPSPAPAEVPVGATPWAGTDTNGGAGEDEDRSVPLPATVFAPPLSGADDDAPRPPVSVPDAKTALMSGGSQLPRTAVAPALDLPNAPGAPGGSPVPGGAPGAPLGSTPPPPPVPGASAYGYPQAPAGPGTPPPGSTPPPGAPVHGYPQGPGAPVPPGSMPPPAVPPQAPGGPGGPGVPVAGPGGAERPLAPNAGDIADAATSKAAPPPKKARGGVGVPPPPPGAPGTPGARPGSVPPPSAPGASSGGYVPTRLVSAIDPEGLAGQDGTAGGPGAPAAPEPSVTPPGDVHHAATMLAGPAQMGPGVPQPPAPPGMPGAPGAPGMPPVPGAPQPPAAPGVPPAPGAPQPPGAPGVPGAPAAPGARGAVHQAETMLAAPPVGGPGVPPPPPPAMPGAPGVPPGVPGTPPMPPAQMAAPMPGQPAGYGYPQAGQPTVGPGYQAVLRYRAQDGSEQQLIRRSAPGTPHPEWQIFHELRSMNVPPDQVLELHTELESCELPGAYCARMIREQWPQARITSIAPYGTDHASRQQGMGQLLAHQGELHQVADGPARPAPVRAPLPPVQAAPPVPPEAAGQELAAAFGPGVFRFEQQAVSRQGVPPVVAHTLVVAGLPVDMGPFFWAQAQPGRPVPTLAELAAERGVAPAADAGSYLVMGTDFGKALCVQYGTAHIVAVPVEAGPGGAPVPPQFVNTGLPEFVRCLALLGRMWRLRYGLNQEQAGRWTVDFQAQLAALDPAALGSPESWWSVLLEQMWDGLL
ncbi:SUKH-4 family immunity protein [Streptomyces murinus]|uniref:SUKH-4 family immunity protein n=1 Tax=Streptomyces murinus TaxID=33900 RepID=UPI003792D3B2